MTLTVPTCFAFPRRNVRLTRAGMPRELVEAETKEFGSYDAQVDLQVGNPASRVPVPPLTLVLVLHGLTCMVCLYTRCTHSRIDGELGGLSLPAFSIEDHLLCVVSRLPGTAPKGRGGRR